jgi:hypothetical protein
MFRANASNAEVQTVQLSSSPKVQTKVNSTLVMPGE